MQFFFNYSFMYLVLLSYLVYVVNVIIILDYFIRFVTSLRISVTLFYMCK